MARMNVSFAKSQGGRGLCSSAVLLRTPDTHWYVQLVIRFPDMASSGCCCVSVGTGVQDILLVSAGLAEKCKKEYISDFVTFFLY
jgi:hypothetical protein